MRWLHVMLVAAALAGPQALRAQREPHIAYIYPAGGLQGTTVEVVIGGQFLAGPTNLCVSGAGIAGEVIDYSRPPNARELASMRERVKQLQERKAASDRANKNPGRKKTADPSTNAWTSVDEKELEDLRRKVANATRRSNPEISEPVTVAISIAKDAEPGPREVRLRSAAGLSNPLTFQVGQLPEFSEEAGAPDTRARFGRSSRFQPASRSEENEMPVTIPAILNGQIMPGGVDRYRFHAVKGQRLVVAVQARQLIPYLANAVPGWFQAAIALFDSTGEELAFQDDFNHNPDPAFYYEIPADGEYVVGIWDALYRGREDFVYRLMVAEAPFVTSSFPLGGRAGETVAVQAAGWNLANCQIQLNLPHDNTRLLSLGLTNAGLASNLSPFAVDDLPERLEAEPNNSLAAAQKIDLPVILNGRIDSQTDADHFTFRAPAGTEIVAEVIARRLNSPLDSHLRLVDSAGSEIAVNDDYEDKGAGLTSHHADSLLRATIPTDGVCTLQLTDTQRQGGAGFGYRLRVSAPRPGFDLRVVPSSINLRPGSVFPITVYALRHDGFTNEIELALVGAPEGFQLSGARIPCGQDKVRLTLTAPGRPVAEPASLVIEGRAMIGATRVARRAVPAEDMMQAFAYRHLVPARELTACVVGERPLRPIRLAQEGPVILPRGGSATVEFKSNGRSFPEDIAFKLLEPPEGISIEKFACENGAVRLTLRSMPETALQAGNLIAMAVPPSPLQTTNAPARQGRSSAIVLPAFPFVLVENGGPSAARPMN